MVHRAWMPCRIEKGWPTRRRSLTAWCHGFGWHLDCGKVADHPSPGEWNRLVAEGCSMFPTFLAELLLIHFSKHWAGRGQAFEYLWREEEAGQVPYVCSTFFIIISSGWNSMCLEAHQSRVAKTTVCCNTTPQNFKQRHASLDSELVLFQRQNHLEFSHCPVLCIELTKGARGRVTKWN